MFQHTRRFFEPGILIRLLQIATLAFASPALAVEAVADEAGAAPGAASCAPRVAAAVQTRYESVRDLDASFVQRTRSIVLGGGALAADQEAAGHVIFAKPGRMRWHYRTPQESLVISDGATLWLVDPSAREAQRMPVTEGFLSGAALAFLVGEGDLLGEFEVALASGSGCGAEETELALTPRSPTSYERLELRVQSSTGDVAETRIFDLFGNVTAVEFRDMRVNLDPAAERFRYEPAEDVRVIDLTPPPKLRP